MTVTVLLDTEGNPAGLAAAAQDITERKQAEAELKRERQLFVDGPAVVFRWVNTEGWPVEYVSPNVQQLIGYSADDLTSGQVAYPTVVHPDDLMRVAEEVQTYSEEGRASFEQEYRMVRADGEIIWIYDFTVIVRNEYGEITHYDGYILDITERKKLEESLKENEALSITVSAADEDTDNKLTYSAEGLPSGATFDAQSGVLSWTPGFDQAGDYSVTFKVSDGKEEASATANLTVENVNRAPQISGPSSETVQAGESLSFSYSGSDADGDDLSFDASGLPSGASFNSGSFSWTPGDTQAGSYSITVSVSDGTDKAEMTTKIVVTEKPAPAPPDTSAH
jgi:PAS domain S-box-containing protein